MPLFDSLISPALDGASKIISQFHLSPEDKVKAEQAMAELRLQSKQQANDQEVKLNDIAGQNIRSDAQSQDKFTQRARPLFMYIIEAILTFNFIGIPIAKMFGLHAEVIVLPADLLVLFGVCVTGYVFNRSAEKIAAMPGSSTFSFLGMTASNDSR
jgi:holin (3TMs family)